VRRLVARGAAQRAAALVFCQGPGVQHLVMCPTAPRAPRSPSCRLQRACSTRACAE
jgi:hypothetical protein